MVYPGVVCRVLLSYLIGVTLQLRFYGFVLGYSLATFANGFRPCGHSSGGNWGNWQTVI